MKKLLLVMALILGLSIPCLADTTVTFTWDKNSEQDLAGYRLYQTKNQGVYIFGEENAVATIPAGTEAVTLEDVLDGEYWWVLTAYDVHLNESGESNEVTIILDTTPPAVPKTLNVVITVKVVIDG